MEGVYRTRVGYAGGTLEDPTYRRMGDHAETFQVDYDPNIIGYDDILKVFWDNHNPAARSWSRQYMAIIFYHNPEQQEAALRTRRTAGEKLGVTVQTEVQPFSRFYLAEDYHQKYYLQNVAELNREIKQYYPDFTGYINSTVAARLNGIVGGYGDPNLVEKELDKYGLSTRGENIIRDVVF